MALHFEWAKRKAELNLRAHGVSCGEVTSVFVEPRSITIADPDRSWTETRFIDLGLPYLGRLLVISYTEDGS